MLEQIFILFTSHMSIIYDFMYEISMLVLTLIPILKAKKSGVMKIRIPLKKMRAKVVKDQSIDN